MVGNIALIGTGYSKPLDLARALQIIKPKAFATLFSQIMANVEIISKKRVVALDGKALAGTYHKEERKGLIYMVGAWCSENKISLAQINTQAKSNEITAIPELLDLKGAIVTMDAMGCQKDLVKKIVKEKKADYLIGLRANQGTMHREFLEYAQASRSHWGIENNLHWVLDVGFREDQWLTRLQLEAANLS
ncbi:hypothetical protein SATMO3_19260 [Sporomusa aerivorans]